MNSSLNHSILQAILILSIAFNAFILLSLAVICMTFYSRVGLSHITYTFLYFKFFILLSDILNSRLSFSHFLNIYTISITKYQYIKWGTGHIALPPIYRLARFCNSSQDCNISIRIKVVSRSLCQTINSERLVISCTILCDCSVSSWYFEPSKWCSE